MATNPLPPHRDLPTLADQKKNKKSASPMVPLGILVAAIILIALIVYLPKTPRRPDAPSNATVPAQPTGTQVQLSNVRLSAGPVGYGVFNPRN